MYPWLGLRWGTVIGQAGVQRMWGSNSQESVWCGLWAVWCVGSEVMWCCLGCRVWGWVKFGVWSVIDHWCSFAGFPNTSYFTRPSISWVFWWFDEIAIFNYPEHFYTWPYLSICLSCSRFSSSIAMTSRSHCIQSNPSTPLNEGREGSGRGSGRILTIKVHLFSKSNFDPYFASLHDAHISNL